MNEFCVQQNSFLSNLKISPFTAMSRVSFGIKCEISDLGIKKVGIFFCLFIDFYGIV